MRTTFKLACLIPLRPKDDISRWTTAVRLLQQTLGSLLAQSDPRWIAVICGHDEPSFLDEIDDPRITFHRVDWEPPHPRGPRIDKSWKVAFAAMVAARSEPTHFMALDADDLLRDDFVAITARHADNPAILFDHGWEIDIRMHRALRRDHLASICGSTAVLSCGAFPLPLGRGWDEWNKVPYVQHGHQEIERLLADRGLAYHRPDQPCVAYLTGHQASLRQRHLINPWRRWLGFRLLGKPITSELSESFSLKMAAPETHR